MKEPHRQLDLHFQGLFAAPHSEDKVEGEGGLLSTV